MMAELVVKVEHAIESNTFGDVWAVDHAARAAIEAVFDWLATPSVEAMQVGADNLVGSHNDDWTEDAREIWSAMLAQMKREALGGEDG